MVKLTVVVGLPGSGKSHLIREMKPSCPGICVEDFMADSIHNQPDFTHSKHYRETVEALREGKDCVIADIAYCNTWKRLEVEQIVRQDVAGVTLAWVFFENDPDQCQTNIDRPDRQRTEEQKEKEKKVAKDLSSRYFVPQGAVVIPVWRPSA